MTRPTCSIEGCMDPVQARGWCIAHYGAWYRNGDPNTLKRAARTLGSHENRVRRFTPESWGRLLDRQHEPHPQQATLRAGVEQFRKMLER